LNIYLIPGSRFNEAAGLNRLISRQPGWRHSAPAAFFVDKKDNQTVFHLPTKVTTTTCDYIYGFNLKVSGNLTKKNDF
jgi:hypothetical protein